METINLGAADGLPPVDWAAVVETAFGHRQHAVGGRDRLGVDAVDRPLVEVPFRLAVGEPQRLDHGRNRHHGEFRHQNQRHGLRQLTRLVAKHRTAIGLSPDIPSSNPRNIGSGQSRQ